MGEERAIPWREALDVEFKSDRRRLPDSELVDTVVALSNSDGGRVYLGVEDDGTPTGLHPAHADTTQLAALIANRTVPPVSARVTRVLLDGDGVPAEDGCSVAVLEIPRSQAVVSSSDGKMMRRRLKADGTPQSVPLYPHEIVSRLSTLGRMDYSALPMPDATMDDLDPGELRHLRDILARSQSGDPSLLGLNDEELLAALQMTTAVEGTMTPTVTGLLLAGKAGAIRRFLPTHGATFQVLEGTEVRVNADFDQALLSTIERIGDMFDPWNSEREFEDGLFRVPVPEFSKTAFREALVNAFGHRDYTMLGSVAVRITDEGLTVASPGGFVDGVTLENLLTVEPRGRNQCLMNALKRVGLAERTGRGVDRIYEGSLMYGRPVPDYSATTSACVSLLLVRSAPDEPFMRMLENARARSGKALSLRALLALDALKSQRRLTAAQLAESLHATMPMTRAVIEELVELGLVEGRGSSTARTYMLSAGAYRVSGGGAAYVRQAGIDSVRQPELIMRLARQQGSVTTKDVENLLQISNKQAYRRLAKLVQEGELLVEGAGRATRYVPVERPEG